MTARLSAGRKKKGTHAVMADPIHQFEIHNMVSLGHIGGQEIAFTNSALYMAITAVGLTDPWAVRELTICIRGLADLPPYARQLVEHLRSDG